ncbi:hypothetical protein D3C75_1017060 [compost metagenome]
MLPLVRQAFQCHNNGNQPHGQVNQEQGFPAEIAGQPASQGWAEGWGQHGGQTPQAHGKGLFFPLNKLVDHGHSGGNDEAAEHGLCDAEGNEGMDGPSDGAKPGEQGKPG